MAAVGIHIVYIGRKPVKANGTVLDKNTATIADMTQASSENRILPASDVENSSGYPSIETFLKAEAAAGYKAAVINQTMIILYNG